MKIYLCQIKNNKQDVGTPLLTASEKTAKSYLNYLKQKNLDGYVHIYDVKTQGKNFGNYAVAQYFDETKEPF